MLALDRRAFVMGSAAVSVFGLPAVTQAARRVDQPKSLILLGHRRVPVSSSSITIPLRRQVNICGLAVRTEAGGYWLDRVELKGAHGIRSDQSIRRRVLPGFDLDLALEDMPPHGWSLLILHHAYLPLNSGRASIEIWARAT
jgi:hypothetical protein